MADYLTPTFDSIRQHIVTAWPEVAANGVWHAVELGTRHFAGLAAQNKVPFAVIDASFSPTTDWGGGNLTFLGTVNVYYVASNTSGVEALYVKLLALIDEVWVNLNPPTLGTYAQVITLPAPSVSFSNPVNAYFLSSNKPFYGGMVSIPVLVGESLG